MTRPVFPTTLIQLHIHETGEVPKQESFSHILEAYTDKLVLGLEEHPLFNEGIYDRDKEADVKGDSLLANLKRCLAVFFDSQPRFTGDLYHGYTASERLIRRLAGR
jgi:hypothetical protein